MTTGVPEAVATFVATELASRADAGTKDWWTRYLKGEATFVHLVTEPPPFEGFHDLIVDVCERNVADPTRWSQTSVGWVMRELSQQAPRTVERFVSTNAERMSSEAVRAATKHL